MDTKELIYYMQAVFRWVNSQNECIETALFQEGIIDRACQKKGKIEYIRAILESGQPTTILTQRYGVNGTLIKQVRTML